MNNIIKVLKKIAPLSELDCDRFIEITTTSRLIKNDCWIKAGIKNNTIAFLEEGYLRKYYLKDGKEVTDSFYFRNDFCADLPSIISNTTPDATIVAMKNTILTTFSYNDFNELCKISPALEHLFRVIVELTFLRFYNRTISFILKSPRERYDDLVVNNPQILNNAAQYHIASYLGISPQHLSRLRATKKIY